MDWKELKRHPLSAEYADITGPAWFRFCQKMKRFGFLARFPILLHEGMVLDGWQRFRACVETNTTPDFDTLPDGLDPREYVECVNDERRHETTEARKERIERVAERRKAGESTRTIAENEGISPTQARRDLEEAKSGAPGGGAPETANGKVTGKDGKKQSATKKKPRCDRCQRLWPNSETFRPGCLACTELRRAKQAPEEPPEVQETNEKPPEPIVDDDGKTVPDRLLAVFRMVKHFRQFEAQLAKASKLAKEIENSAPLKEKKPLSGKKHYGEMFGAIKNARWRVKAMRPSLVCECDSAGCPKCGFLGYLTQEEADAKEIKP